MFRRGHESRYLPRPLEMHPVFRIVAEPEPPDRMAKVVLNRGRSPERSRSLKDRRLARPWQPL